MHSTYGPAGGRARFAIPGSIRLAATAALLAAAALLALSGCLLMPSAKSQPVQARFQQLTNEFIQTHFAHRPLLGVVLGWHQYDGAIVVPDADTLATEAARLSRFAAEFRSLPVEKLLPAQRHDVALIQSVIAGELWARQHQGQFRRNPMVYADGIDVSGYLKRDFKPLAQRLLDIAAILDRVPEYLTAARNNLEPVLPRPFIDTAIDSAEGTAVFLETDVLATAKEVRDPSIRALLEKSVQPAAAAYREYAAWLRSERLPLADDSFALGRDAYIAMLEAEGITLAPEELLEIAMRELRREQQRFADAAKVLDPNLTPIEAARVIQRDHPTAEGLIPDTRRNLEAIRQFLIDQDIVTIPSEVRARVEETLPPFRATSFASMDTPGPFETRATEAYYYVTPVEPEWSDRQKEEWLGAFNYYTTDIVSIHEAYPGHYLQFLVLNASSASVAAKVFTSYPFVEGWAHYTEQMMIEEGFGQPRGPGATRPELERAAKYRLAQSLEALLRLCRMCCSIQLHTQGVSVDAATRFFMENCYCEEQPARAEAVRGTYDPGYLYYTLGKLMILKLRSDWQEQEGARYSLKRFHDEVLSHGAPPIPLLRQLMLTDAARWPDLL